MRPGNPRESAVEKLPVSGNELACIEQPIQRRPVAAKCLLLLYVVWLLFLVFISYQVLAD